MGVVFGKPLTPAEVARRVWDAGYPTKEPCYVCAAVDARTTVDNLSGIYPMCEGCILQCASGYAVVARDLPTRRAHAGRFRKIRTRTP